MRSLLIFLALLAQFGQRPPLSPAETLLEPVVLRALADALSPDSSPIDRIPGTETGAGEILVSCGASDGCEAAHRAARTLQSLIAQNGLPRPARTIRVISLAGPEVHAVVDKEPSLPGRVKAALHIHLGGDGDSMSVFRSPWSRATIADEVVEIFARHTPNGAETIAVDVRPFASIVSPDWHLYGIPTVNLGGANTADGAARAAFVTAATAYFLATLPNAGAEALLSHLTVGAHARLAEDGRRAVALMGPQQRASADVLILVGQAIEREQRRMRSFAAFMPAVDPMLESRLTDMEKGITGVWVSLGISSSPFTPAAQRIRGRGGEDRRVPARTGKGTLPAVTPVPAGLVKLAEPGSVEIEIRNFIDGKRSISDIRDAVSAEFGPIALPVVVDYIERLGKTGAVSIR